MYFLISGLKGLNCFIKGSYELQKESLTIEASNSEFLRKAQETFEIATLSKGSIRKPHNFEAAMQ